MNVGREIEREREREGGERVVMIKELKWRMVQFFYFGFLEFFFV